MDEAEGLFLRLKPCAKRLPLCQTSACKRIVVPVKPSGSAIPAFCSFGGSELGLCCALLCHTPKIATGRFCLPARTQAEST